MTNKNANNNLENIFTKLTASFGGSIHHFIHAECLLIQFNDMLAKLYEFSFASLDKNCSLSILKISIFISDNSHLSEIKKSISCQYWLDISNVEFVMQKPASGKQIGVQVWGLQDNKQADIASCPGVNWAFNFDVSSVNREVDFCAGFSAAWTRLLTTAKFEEYDQFDILRTWIYIGDINGNEYSGDHYQQINTARKNIFTWLDKDSKNKKLSYPASTGIGQENGFFGLGILMCKVEPPLQIVSIENDKQTSAFYYPPSESKVPPLFSRAVAIFNENSAFLIVSGTASIIEAYSVHIDCAEKQTLQTLKNIESLIDSVQLPKQSAQGLNALKSCVVYIKYQSDYLNIKKVCQEYLPDNIIINYNIADVCRPELLVEIEAIAII